MQTIDVRTGDGFDKRDWYFTGGVTNFTQKERDFLSMDSEGLYSTTQAQDAQRTTHLISRLPGLSVSVLGRRPVITDACACCGGNALSFLCSNMFDHVNIVEIDHTRCAKHLKPNVEFATQARRPHTTYNLINGDYVQTCDKLAQDVVFLDVPWGGPEYKQQKCLDLCLSHVPLANLAVRLLKHTPEDDTNAMSEFFCPHAFFYSKNMECKYVVLKLPLNFNVEKLESDAEAAGCVCQVMQSFKKFNLYVMQLGWRESVL